MTYTCFTWKFARGLWSNERPREMEHEELSNQDETGGPKGENVIVISFVDCSSAG